MNRLLALTIALSLVVWTSTARANCGSCGQDANSTTCKEGKADKGKVETVTITGKLTKEVTKDKKGMEIVKYVLTDASGKKVNLPPAKKTDPSVKYEDYVNSDVKVTGAGRTKKDGTMVLRTITTIEKSGTTPAATAAPAPAAEKTCGANSSK